jgi:uncharacterized membrane protein YcgQ (UPF0703/DUF1980 family)
MPRRKPRAARPTRSSPGPGGPHPRPPREGAEAYRLTRFVIFCFAADAEALQVVVHGDLGRRGRDQWLEVEGRWPRPATPAPPPTLAVDAVRPLARPHEYNLQYGG